MTRAQQFKLMKINGRFRHGLKQFEPFETPDIWPMLGLLETLERLTNKHGERLLYANRETSERRVDVNRNAADVRSGAIVPNHSDGVRWR